MGFLGFPCCVARGWGLSRVRPGQSPRRRASDFVTFGRRRDRPAHESMAGGPRSQELYFLPRNLIVLFILL